MSGTKLILLAAPSGAGKSSFVERMCRDFSDRIVDIVTYTTRTIRKGEREGVDYHYVSPADFEAMIKSGELVEWARVHENYYGIGQSVLEAAWVQGKVGIIDVDVQGVRTIRRKFPEITKTVFILPPSIDELRRRIVKRDGGTPKDLEIRMKTAEQEMTEAPEFHAQIVNDNFDSSYAEFKKVVESWLGPG